MTDHPVTMMTILQPCPPHQWSHAPTVGYYMCGKCRERRDWKHPKYAEAEAEYRQPATLGVDVEALGEALFMLSDKLRASGILSASDAVHDAYENVVKAFQAIATIAPQLDVPGDSTLSNVLGSPK
jgi:hypothetical protein